MHEQYQYQKAHLLYYYQVTKYTSMFGWVQTEYLQPTKVSNIPQVNHSFSEVSVNLFNFIYQTVIMKITQTFVIMKITQTYNVWYMAIETKCKV